MSAQPHYGGDPHLRRLCVILRRLLDREGPFPSWADLRGAYADELSGYHIAYEGWEVDAAFGLIGSNRPLLTRDRPAVYVDRPVAPSTRAISKTDASAILARLGVRLPGGA